MQQRYRGSCHCGQVRYEIEGEITAASQCNCSICTKKGVINARVAPERLHILQGKEALALYQFGTHTAKHWFCRHCGIQVFANPRRAPDQFAVNLRCLDDFYRLMPTLPVRQFDGQHWERAVAAENAGRT
jgi:hypothetical protein